MVLSDCHQIVLFLRIQTEVVNDFCEKLLPVYVSGSLRQTCTRENRSIFIMQLASVLANKHVGGNGFGTHNNGYPLRVGLLVGLLDPLSEFVAIPVVARRSSNCQAPRRCPLQISVSLTVSNQVDIDSKQSVPPFDAFL